MNVARVIPRHVAACQHAPGSSKPWVIWTWKRASPQTQTRIPYSCNSWRCEVCKRHEAAVTFARIKQATAPLDPSGWCFLVLTLDRDGYYGGKPWHDVTEAYRVLGKMTAATLKRIGATWGPESRLEGKKRPRFVRKLGNRWVGVVEAHRSGWPHVNLLVWCPELAAELRAEHAERLDDPEIADAVVLARDAWARKEPVPARIREVARKATIVAGAVGSLLVDVGWGRQSTAEAARSSEAIAGYVVKLVGEHDASAGELAKITQAPLNAPERFRRLRTGRLFLPPRKHNPEITGCLLRRREHGERWRHGDLHTMNPPKDPAQNEPTLRAARAELQIMREEQAVALRARGRSPPPMPPVRFAFRGTLEPHLETSKRRAAMRERAVPLVPLGVLCPRDTS